MDPAFEPVRRRGKGAGGAQVVPRVGGQDTVLDAAVQGADRAWGLVAGKPPASVAPCEGGNIGGVNLGAICSFLQPRVMEFMECPRGLTRAMARSGVSRWPVGAELAQGPMAGRSSGSWPHMSDIALDMDQAALDAGRGPALPDRGGRSPVPVGDRPPSGRGRAKGEPCRRPWFRAGMAGRRSRLRRSRQSGPASRRERRFRR